VSVVEADHLRARVDALAELVRRQAEQLIQTDGLTGLLNQRGLHYRLDDLLDGDDPFWCAFVELDKFKSINSRFGQTNGDGLLQEVAGALEKVANDNAAIAFRAHGDEFYLVGMGDGVEGIARAAVEAVHELKVKARGLDEVMRCTASVGFLMITSDDAVSRSDLLERTEHAVHHAKLGGRNQAVAWDAGMDGPSRTVEIRPDCADCGTKFTADLPRESRHQVYCPRCGQEVDLSDEDRLALAPPAS